MLSIIVAKSKNNAIGKNNQLLWSISDDLKRFKQITLNHTVIMGRKTFESIGKVLPKRKNIILTHNLDFEIDNENVEIVNSVHDLEKYIESNEECFVIGGGIIYNMLLPRVTKMYITEVDVDIAGDTFFPKFNKDEWTEIERIKGPTDKNFPYKYEYVTYQKKVD